MTVQPHEKMVRVPLFGEKSGVNRPGVSGDE